MIPLVQRWSKFKAVQFKGYRHWMFREHQPGRLLPDLGYLVPRTSSTGRATRWHIRPLWLLFRGFVCNLQDTSTSHSLVTTGSISYTNQLWLRHSAFVSHREGLSSGVADCARERAGTVNCDPLPHHHQRNLPQWGPKRSQMRRLDEKVWWAGVSRVLRPDMPTAEDLAYTLGWSAVSPPWIMGQVSCTTSWLHPIDSPWWGRLMVEYVPMASAPGYNDPVGEAWAVGSCYQAGVQGLDYFGIFGDHWPIISLFRVGRYPKRIAWHNANLCETFLAGDATRSMRFHKAVTNCHKAPARFFLTPWVT